MANFCSKCGAELSPDTRFCQGCGAPTGFGGATRRRNSRWASCPCTSPCRYRAIQRNSKSRPDYRWGYRLPRHAEPHLPLCSDCGAFRSPYMSTEPAA